MIYVVLLGLLLGAFVPNFSTTIVAISLIVDDLATSVFTVATSVFTELLSFITSITVALPSIIIALTAPLAVWLLAKYYFQRLNLQQWQAHGLKDELRISPFKRLNIGFNCHPVCRLESFATTFPYASC